MKKFFCLLLSVLTLFLLTGCAKKSNDGSKTSSDSVNIVALAEKGEVPEIEYNLGSNIDELKQKYQTAFSSDQTKPDLQITEGEKTVRMDAGHFIYYYEKEKAAGGISVIACTESIYGFAIGGVTLIEDVKAAIASTPTEGTATENDLFFLPEVPENCKMLTYQIGGNVLKMFFTGDYLTAAVLYNPANWSY